jgi:hypothetical protein
MLMKEAIRKVLEGDNGLLDVPVSRVVAAVKRQFGMEPSRKHVDNVRRAIIQQMKTHPVIDGLNGQAVEDDGDGWPAPTVEQLLDSIDLMTELAQFAQRVGGLKVVASMISKLSDMGVK